MDLQRTIKLSIQNREFTVTFPNWGEIIDIETKKAALANNMYSTLSRANTILGNYALDYIDAVATFSILIPELTNKLRIDSLLLLSMDEGVELITIYKERFFPWYMSWVNLSFEKAKEYKEKVLTAPIIEEEEEDDDGNAG